MAIQQHPLPQDISSYRFRLIGDMTIKQFAFLAAFIIIGIVFYSSPLPFFFKYPLAAIAVGLGIGIAFVPVQGRPLDQWIVAFIKSIYSPTQYTWRQSKSETSSSVNQPAPTPTPAAPQPAIAAKPISVGQQTPATPQPSSTPTATAPAPNIDNTPPQPKKPYSTVAQTPQAAAPVQTPTALPTPTSSPAGVASTSPAPITTLPIPFTPTTPNTLVGLTLNNEGKILDSVLVEIQSKGLTIRATRSNRLGQFMFARPLENGLYQILAEKDGYKFAAYSLDLKGDIVKPLKIQSES